MPPVLRRPAAKAAGRERRGVLRRPAGVDGVPERGGEPRRGGPGEGEAEFDFDGFERGVEVEGYKVPLRLWKKGLKIIITEGLYWEEKVKVAAVVGYFTSSGEVASLWVDLRGSQSEALVKWKGLHPKEKLEVDLCLPGCPHQSKDGLVHCLKVKCWLTEGEEPWTSNLEGMEMGPADELEGLRARASGLPTPPVAPAEGKGAKVDSSTSRESRKGKKKRNSEKKRKKEKVKAQGTKPIKALFEKTGLDPEPSQRKRLLKNAKKVVKFFKQFFVKHRGVESRGGRGLRDLRARGESASSMESSSWMSDAGDVRPHAEGVGAADGATVGFGSGVTPASVHAVLEDSTRPPGVKAYVEGDADLIFLGGLATPRQGGCSMRCGDSKIEVPGADFHGGRLQSLPAAGAGASRGGEHVIPSGNLGSLQAAEGGSQSESCRRKRLGTKIWKRGVRLLGCQRERKEGRVRQGQRKRKQRRWQEGRRKETRGGEGEEMNEKLDGEKAADTSMVSRG